LVERMNNFDYRYLFHLAYSPILLILSVIFIKFRPKKHNSFLSFKNSYTYGNYEAWQEANKFYPKQLFRSSLIASFLQIPTLWLPIKTSFLLAAILMTSALVYSFFSTELLLKKKYGKKEEENNSNKI